MIKALKQKDKFLWRIVLAEVSKKCGKKEAYMNTLINDDIAEFIFKNIDTHHFCVIAVPKNIEELEGDEE